MLLQFLLHVSFLALIILGHMIRCLITGICIFIFVHIARSRADIHMAIKFFLYIYIYSHTHTYLHIYIYAYILVGCRFTAINGLAVEVHNEKGKASFDFFQLLRGRGVFSVYLPLSLGCLGLYIYIYLYTYICKPSFMIDS